MIVCCWLKGITYKLNMIEFPYLSHSSLEGQPSGTEIHTAEEQHHKSDRAARLSEDAESDLEARATRGTDERFRTVRISTCLLCLNFGVALAAHLPPLVAEHGASSLALLASSQ